ncbi:MAG: hypothetical protein IPJ06_19535 [Saprospiraceae bacterium]|nr:hypothetical protein [Saprospiraceae bacterium]
MYRFRNATGRNPPAHPWQWRGPVCQPATIEGEADHFRTTHLTIGAEALFLLHAVVTNMLEFEGGDNVITGGTSEIRLQTTVPASILNFGPDAYIEGRLRRDLLSGTNGYDFPVGNAAHYAHFKLDITTTDAPNLLGYFDPLGPARVLPPVRILHQVSLPVNMTISCTVGGWNLEPERAQP